MEQPSEQEQYETNEIEEGDEHRKSASKEHVDDIVDHSRQDLEPEQPHPVDDDDDDGFKDNGLARYSRVRRVVNAWPRTTAFICRIVLPLWILIGIALGFGQLLGQYEEPNEYTQNDEIVKERFILKQFPAEDVLRVMYNMSRECIDFYIDVKDETTNTTSSDGYLPTYLELKGLEGSFPNVTVGFENQATQEVLQEIHEFMTICSFISVSLADDIINYTEARVQAEAFEDLTFNWIRCWNSTLYGGMNPFRASHGQILAANNQSAFYTEAWEHDQQRLYKLYLRENGCMGSLEDGFACKEEAFAAAVNDATGSGLCSVNTGGSAFFWFTVMTTVGYGNQSPVTSQGRGLVSGLGWISIVIFGGLSVIAGRVMAVMFDDFFKKYRLTFLTKDWTGTIFWGFNSVLWLLIQSSIGYTWWQDRLPAMSVSRYEALWWSYISSTTVGLGDFFLSPEVMFIVDVFVWSLVFLFGFVILTTFLNKVTTLIGNRSMDAASILEERLSRTNPFTRKLYVYKKSSKSDLQDINALLNMMDDAHAYNNLDITLRKREILIRMLHQTEQELADFSNYARAPSKERLEQTKTTK